MKKYFRFLIVCIGTIGILSLIFNEAFVTNPEHPLHSLHILKYFTIQSNLVAVIYFWILISLKLDERNMIFKKLIGGVTVYTTITFIIFATLLEAQYDEKGLSLLGSICLHYINPVLIIGYVVTFKDDFEFRMKDSLIWVIYPVIYLIFLVIMGVVTGDYMYPFFQVSEVGVMGLSLMIFALIGLFFLLSFLVVKILSKKSKAFS